MDFKELRDSLVQLVSRDPLDFLGPRVAQVLVVLLALLEV